MKLHAGKPACALFHRPRESSITTLESLVNNVILLLIRLIELLRIDAHHNKERKEVVEGVNHLLQELLAIERLILDASMALPVLAVL